MGSDILAGRAILSFSAAVMIAPAAFFVPFPSEATWYALLLAIPAHFTYQLCLIGAMQRGDLSLVFPIMRGGAPMLTAIVAFVILGEKLSLIEVSGLIIASIAVLIFVLPPKGTRLRSHPDRRVMLWALATSFGIAFYTTLDARGIRIAGRPETFIVWLFILDAICISSTALIVRRSAMIPIIKERWKYGTAAGFLSILSFGAALYALSLIETAKVSALRETAVVFAALFGAIFLKEGFGMRRILAAALLAVGLIIMQFAG